MSHFCPSIVSKVKGGIATENDILQTLYCRYYNSAYLYCLALCGKKELAEDLVAEAFVKAYLSLPDEIPSFQYWLFRVCKNLWIDYLRKEKRLTSDEDIPYVADTDTPELQYLKKERNLCLWNAMRSLSPTDREIVTMYYFSGIPLQEIARLLGKSYVAVRQRLTRLRQTLKLRMEEQGYDI